MSASISESPPIESAAGRSSPGPRPAGRAVWWYILKLVLYRPGLYLFFGLLEILFFSAFPQVTAWAVRQFFDTLSGQAAGGLNPYFFAALLVAIALGRAVAIFLDVIVYFNFRYSIEALLRKNLFECILEKPAASALPASSGEAISRFRDDVQEVAFFMAELFTLLAFGSFFVGSIIVMLRIDVRITLLVFLPLVLIVLAANLAMKQVGRYRQANREATGLVTGFIGELFGAVHAVQANSAEEPVLERFRQLNDQRRVAAVRDRFFNEVLESLYRNTSNIGIGVTLLAASQAMLQGSFTIGDLAIFAFYLRINTDFMAIVGEKIAWYRQVGVSLERLMELLPGDPPERLVAYAPVYASGPLPPLPPLVRTPQDRLATLELRRLTWTYPGERSGIYEIDLKLKRGAFTVITGRVGSGKTTLLRLLLGLLEARSGEILWNGLPVASPKDFFRPPRSAYTPQSPALFSETLRENILMGLPADQAQLDRSLWLSVMEQDLAALPQGLDTVLGARGLRLSGGQRQRCAAARMFVRQPELLVFDDISSALDIDTERLLWERLVSLPEATVLAVSHRRPALLRADQIIVMKNGRVDGVGRLEELLESNEEMRRLWLLDETAQESNPAPLPPGRLSGPAA